MVAIRLILHGKAGGNAEVREAVAAARERGATVEVRVTWEAGDAARLAVEAVADARDGRIDRIVAGGGDGTVNAVFAAAYLASPPETCSFGIMPLGTANDFATSAGIPIGDPGAALALVANAAPRSIDLGLLDDRPFVNLVTGGFGSQVTVETDETLKRRLGGLAYLLTGVTRFSELGASEGRFRAEDFCWEGRFMAMAIGNGRQAGGGVPLCPDAMIDDGLLDLMILPELSGGSAHFDALTTFLRDGAGGLEEIGVTSRCKWFTYESDEELCVNLDGEPIRTRGFRVECLPGALRVHLGDTPLLS